VAVVAFISVRDHSGVKAPHAIAPAPQGGAVIASQPAVTVSREARADVMAASIAAPPAETPQVIAAVESSHSPGSEITLASAPAAPGGISRMIPLIGASVLEGAEEEQSPSARAIAANLASVRGAEPILARTLLSNVTAADLQPAARSTVEPLQQITPPGDRRRSSILTAMVTMSSFETPARNGDRVATRLSEDELYDRIHRFGARGNSVSMKF
jgi:hypothetical protein